MRVSRQGEGEGFRARLPLVSELPPPLPSELRRSLPAARWERVAVGESGAGVWRSARFVLKVQARGLPQTLFAERERLRWFAGRLPVPPLAGYAVDAEREFLVMTRLPGIDLSHPDAVLHAARNTRLMALALRELHALPIQECPFDMTLPTRLKQARELLERGLVDESDFDDEHLGRSGAELLAELVRTRPAKEDLVVTHGDACCPNFIGQGELLSGLIDLGRAGIADRHMDLALAHRSIGRNYGPEHAEAFLDAYGRELVDEGKLAYYRLLDELF